MVTTRFAPSPTGDIHTGNLRIALLAYYFAKKNSGRFILRIEDTDTNRSKPEFTHSLIQVLKSFGIAWQSYPEADFFQSARQEIYHQYLDKLKLQNLLYECFCHTREQQLRSHYSHHKACPCKDFSDEQKQSLAKDFAPAWRFAVPAKEYVFVDSLKGEQRLPEKGLKDFILQKAKGDFPFLFANAIDDMDMQVSHVIRGEDHITNTFRQLALFEVLGSPVPEFAHFPLILGESGKPLAKRDQTGSLEALIERGVHPLALANYILRIGNSLQNQELLPFNQLGNLIEWTQYSRSSAQFQDKQLQFWQKKTMQQLSQEDFADWLKKGGFDKIVEEMDEDKLFILQSEATLYQDIQEMMLWLFDYDKLDLSQEQQEALRGIEPDFFKTSKELLSAGIAFDAFVSELSLKTGKKGKQLFIPLRLALTKRNQGPQIGNILKLLGRQEAERRLSGFC